MKKRSPKNCIHRRIFYPCPNAIDSDRHLVECKRCCKVGRDCDNEFQLGLKNLEKEEENYRKSSEPSSKWRFGKMLRIGAGGDCEFGHLIDLETGKELSWQLLGCDGRSDRHKTGTMLKFQPNRRLDDVCAVAPLTPLELEYYRLKLTLRRAINA